MEIWKNFKDISSLKEFDAYFISSEGKVRCEKWIWADTGMKNKKLKITYPTLTIGNNGYYRIFISNRKKSKIVSFHRIIAMAFIPNPDNKRTVNHKNGIKTDNRMENLEWATDKENTNHSIKILGKHFSNKKKIICMNTGIIYESASKAAIEMGLNRGHISNSARGTYGPHKGYTFKYL